MVAPIYVNLNPIVVCFLRLKGFLWLISTIGLIFTLIGAAINAALNEKFLSVILSVIQ